MSLYWFDYKKLASAAKHADLPGLDAWCSISKSFHNIMVDRQGAIRSPIRTTLDPAVRIPNPADYPRRTFDDCCFERTKELLDISKATGKQLYLMFSGGIDSTAFFSSFLMHHSLSTLQERITVVISTEAWIENPRFVKEHLLGKFRFVSSSETRHFFDGRAIVVSGEMNDYYVPNSQQKKLNELRGEGESTAPDPYSVDRMISYLEHCGLSQDHARTWAGILDEDRKRAYVDVATLRDMLWWTRFNWTRQAYKFLPIIGMNTHAGKISNLDEFHTRVRHFFDTPLFEVWAMLNTDRSPRKHHCRALIRKYTKDDEWVDQKQKFDSLRMILRTHRAAAGVDENFNLIYPYEALLRYYNPDNDFL